MNESKIFKVLLLAATLLLAGCTGDAEEEEELAPSDDSPQLSTYSFERIISLSLCNKLII